MIFYLFREYLSYTSMTAHAKTEIMGAPPVLASSKANVAKRNLSAFLVSGDGWSSCTKLPGLSYVGVSCYYKIKRQ